MIEKVFYLEANETTERIINEIINKFICFCKKEIIEMNYLEITIKCRIEDAKAIERIIEE